MQGIRGYWFEGEVKEHCPKSIEFSCETILFVAVRIDVQISGYGMYMYLLLIYSYFFMYMCICV